MVTPESPPTQDTGTGAAAVPAELFDQDFTGADVTALRHALRRHTEAAGLHDDALDDFVTAVNELVTNAVRHGGGAGRLRLTLDADTVIADVSDHGDGFPGELPVAGSPPATDVPGGRGMLLARRLTDNLMISAGPDGVTVTVTMCIAAQPDPQ